MHTLNLLSQHDDYVSQLQELGIKMTVDPMFPYLMNLCYDQIEASKMHPITIECRGLVVDTGNFKVQGRPFDRFFNVGEALNITEKINYNDCTVTEKLDGSLIKIYYSERYSMWLVGTKGTPTSRNSMVSKGDKGLPLLYLIAEYFGIDVKSHVSNYYTGYRQEYIDGGDFNAIMKQLNEIFDSTLYRGYTYICELVSPENQIVTKYDKTELYLLNIRDNISGEYIDQSIDIFKIPKVYECSGLDDIRVAVQEINKDGNRLNEGFVVTCNETGIRSKIKNTGYLMVHRNLGNDTLDKKTIKDIVAVHEEDEVLSYYPHLEDEFVEMVKQRQDAIERLDKGIKLSNDITDRKELALKLKELKVASAVFYLMKKDYSATIEGWNMLPTKMKVDLMS